jgi:hypothetical protein
MGVPVYVAEPYSVCRTRQGKKKITTGLKNRSETHKSSMNTKQFRISHTELYRIGSNFSLQKIWRRRWRRGRCREGELGALAPLYVISMTARMSDSKDTLFIKFKGISCDVQTSQFPHYQILLWRIGWARTNFQREKFLTRKITSSFPGKMRNVGFAQVEDLKNVRFHP